MTADRTPPDYTAEAKRVFDIESRAIASLGDRIGSEFTSAVEMILASDGRVIVSGMGKSGLVGRKIAATLASTGTPSFFMHPGEAYHGDLGMIGKSDVFIAISNSGETEEVVKLLPFLRENQNSVIAFTGNRTATLSRFANCHIDVGVVEEACPLQLAPTASTTATLAMGDALAVALMAARDFQPEGFARFHPGGSLGRRLLSLVGHEMIADQLPVISGETRFMEVVKAITDSSLGLACVDLRGTYGVVTDGDVRRAVERHGSSIFERSALDLMTISPATVTPTARMHDALEIMESRRISSLLVIDDGALVGILKK